MLEETEVLKGIAKEAKKYKLLTAEQEQHYIFIYKNTSKYSKEWKEAVEILITRNLKLILKLCKKPDGGTLTTYDLFIEGVLGLIHALDKYDASRLTDKGKPMKLSTYAHWWIKQYIQRAIQDKGRTIRIPIHIHDMLNKLRKAHGEYCSTHFDEPPPDSEKLSKILDMDKKLVEKLGTYLFTIDSIDEFSNEEENLTVAQYIPADDKYQPENTIELAANKSYLLSILDKLPEEDSKFIKLKWGIEDKYIRSTREMASIYQCKSTEIIKRESRILAALKELGDPSEVNW